MKFVNLAVVKRSWKNCLFIIRCHEAILIYALVEADAERQVIDKTEFLSEKTRVVKIDDDTPIRAKTVSMLLSLDKAAVVMELDEQPYFFYSLPKLVSYFNS